MRLPLSTDSSKAQSKILTKIGLDFIIFMWGQHNLNKSEFSPVITAILDWEVVN